MQKMKLRMGVLALGLAGATALAGCGASSSSGGNTASTKTTSSHHHKASKPAAKGTSSGGGSGASAVKGAATLSFNAVGFLHPGQTGPTPGFGPNNDLNNATAPKPGPYPVTAGSAKVTFYFPNVSSKSSNSILDVAYGKSASFKVPAGKYSHLYFLAGVASGPEPATIVLHYKGGSTSKQVAAFDDWCTVEISHKPVPGTYPSWQGESRVLEKSGATGNVKGGTYSSPNQGCGLYVSSVPVDKTKTLTSVDVQNTLTAVPSSLSKSITSVNKSSRINIVAVTAN